MHTWLLKDLLHAGGALVVFVIMSFSDLRNITDCQVITKKYKIVLLKGCTHRAMIPCDWGVDSNRKEYSKAIEQWEHLLFAI